MEDHARQCFQNLVRIGNVVSTDPSKGTARVQFPDEGEAEGGMTSYDLQVLHHKTAKDKFYCMPDIGDPVLCAFLSTGLEHGFILGAVYTDQDPTPVNSQDKAHIKFDDGTTIEYDRNEHHLVIDETPPNGDLTITCPNGCTINAKAGMTVNAEDGVTFNAQAGFNVHASGGILLDGPITYTSGLTGTGDAVIDGISHDSHVHGGVQSGGSTTSGPE